MIPSQPGRAGGPTGPLQPVALLVSTMAGALVMIGVVLAILGAELVVPESWMLAVVAAATVVVWGLVLVIPVPRAQGGQSPAGLVQTMTVLRVSLLEAPAILGLALAFVSQPTNLTIYLLPALFALGGIVLFARPSVVRARVEHPGT